ncbi:hypothetical protein LTT66_00955 [Nocardia gipuzkoensis]|nr:hypothetical protein [Nocardia gipuzkoensis]UGT68841.1 hypothetical protein LTT66_00955 [Nocardia gipuzkoensis]
MAHRTAAKGADSNFDEVRARIQRRLHTLGYRHSTSVLFTAQRQWVDWSH